MIRKVPRTITWLVPAAAYIAIFLLLEVEQSKAFWMSIIFLAFSYLMLAVSFVAIPRSRIAPVLRMPLVVVATIYLAVEMTAATVFIYVPSIPYLVVIVSQIAFAAIFLVVYSTTISSNQNIAAELEQQHADVLVIKNAVARITVLERFASNPHLAKSLEGLAEEFCYSPTLHLRETRIVDAEIEEALDGLDTLVRSDSEQEAVLGKIAAVSRALAARNSAIKLRQ